MVSPVCHVLSDSWLLLFLTFNRRTALKQRTIRVLSSDADCTAAESKSLSDILSGATAWLLLIISNGTSLPIGNSKVPVPRKLFSCKCSDHFFVNIRTCYFFLFLIPSNKSRATS